MNLPIEYGRLVENRGAISASVDALPQHVFLSDEAFASAEETREQVLHETCHNWLYLYGELWSLHDRSTHVSVTLPSGTSGRNPSELLGALHVATALIKYYSQTGNTELLAKRNLDDYRNGCVLNCSIFGAKVYTNGLGNCDLALHHFYMTHFTSVDAWPTVLYTKELPESALINDDLIRIISEGSNRTGGTASGMFRGRKADFSLLQQHGDGISALKGAIFEAAEALTLCVIGNKAAAISDRLVAEAWSVLCAPLGFHRVHVHPGAIWSGVYYVSVENLENDSGKIQFLDPRPAASGGGRTTRAMTLSIAPVNGLLIAFPSWLSHWITPVASDRPRLSIAFNVGIAPFE